MSPAKSTLSKTQIDRLGDRLRRGRVEDDDLHLLDAYEQSFAEAYAEAVRRIRNTLDLKPTGRFPKTTMSIVQKLRRESIRLSQMQDIAGCRVIVDGIREQEATLQRVKDLFEDFTIIDRRERPSHGYRAVHVIVESDDRLVEIQLRTVLQDFWAAFCERMAGFDPAIKYGGGDESDRWILDATSEEVAEIESRERDLLDLEQRYAKTPTRALQARIDSARVSLGEQRQLLVEIIWDNFPKLRGNGDLPH